MKEMKGVHSIFMLRPKNFGFNMDTKSTNPLQNRINFEQKYIASKALAEFDDMVETLLKHNVKVQTFEDSDDIDLPDAVFLNNWITITPDKQLYLFPMAAKSRRGERRQPIIDILKEINEVRNVVDLSHYEKEGLYLESTGSIVFDYFSKVAYASVSDRTSEKLFAEFCNNSDFEGHIFNSADINGNPIYHTNILLSVAEKYVILCTDCIENTLERAILVKKIEKTGKELIEISLNQMTNFAGNCMEVFNHNGESKLIMSRTGFSSLKQDQINVIKKYSDIVTVNVSIIERIGGGSVRCMMLGVPY